MKNLQRLVSTKRNTMTENGTVDIPRSVVRAWNVYSVFLKRQRVDESSESTCKHVLQLRTFQAKLQTVSFWAPSSGVKVVFQSCSKLFLQYSRILFAGSCSLLKPCWKLAYKSVQESLRAISRRSSWTVPEKQLELTRFGSCNSWAKNLKKTWTINWEVWNSRKTWLLQGMLQKILQNNVGLWLFM